MRGHGGGFCQVRQKSLVQFCVWLIIIESRDYVSAIRIRRIADRREKLEPIKQNPCIGHLWVEYQPYPLWEHVPRVVESGGRQ